jgi:hypothetical protein
MLHMSRSHVIIGISALLLSTQILAAGPADILKEEAITVQKLEAIFKAAFIKTGKTSFGDLRVAAGPAKVMIKVSEKKKHLYLFAIYKFKDGVALEKKLSFVNKLNNKLTLVKFSVTEKGALWCAYSLPYEGGITPYAIVNTTRTVSKVIASGLTTHDTDSIVR